MFSWPPNHSIRRSRRARRIALSITAKKGVEIVLPHRASIAEGLAFLESKRTWVEKHLSVMIKTVHNETAFPTEVHLTSLNIQFLVRYHHIPHAKKVSFQALNERLVFTGAMENFNVCLPAFNQWLRSLARMHLPAWLSQASTEIQLPYRRVSIRSQKTLWGSCNRQKDISLNDRLLFLPYNLVRYVLIHELCHTVYFGHGKRFWQLVARFDPHYQFHERSLRDVSSHIPSCFCI